MYQQIKMLQTDREEMFQLLLAIGFPVNKLLIKYENKL